MLNTISEVYKNQCGIIHTADFDMLQVRLPIEAILVILPYETQYMKASVVAEVRTQIKSA